MLIPLHSEVSFHPANPREAFFPLAAGQRREGRGGQGGGSYKGGREGGSLATRPIASARFVMSQDLAGLASTSSSRGQREWETQHRLLSNERRRSAAMCH